MDDEDGGLNVKPKKSKAPVEAGKPKFAIKPLAPPPAAGGTKAAAPPATSASGEADILGLSSAPASNAPAPKASNDFDAFFDTPSPPAAVNTGAAPASTSGGAGAATMNDDDFESFLSNLTSPSK